ncbi:hypothetical protein COT29_01520 [Candidatus Micrarchaeota archaeon CG08_land_8_20_14_0_20_59_11]|nr:MAG: hypothetical protein COT29_01520 [Candidatus Micrarchaeota archaeon CG08_land_8_20_14_0_20_59_11]
MILDALALEAKLTPEAALSIIQKSLAQKGWKKHEVADIKLVYTPFWTFSFDVVTGGQGPTPTGRTALNAFSGDLNDLVPVILDRPIKRSKNAQEGAEVESTNVTQHEAKETAAMKIAAHVGGITKDMIAVSALNKIYVPFYRVWVNVADDTYKIEVDAAMGAPAGLDEIPTRKKGWDEATSETIDKMKSPKGWVELGAQTAGAAAGAAKPGGENTRYLIMGAVILVLLWFVFGRGSAGDVSCALDDNYLGTPSLFGIWGSRPVEPAYGINRTLYVRGECDITNTGKEKLPAVIVSVAVKAGGVPVIRNTIVARDIPSTTGMPTQKKFELNWTDTGATDFSFEYEKL